MSSAPSFSSFPDLPTVPKSEKDSRASTDRLHDQRRRRYREDEGRKERPREKDEERSRRQYKEARRRRERFKAEELVQSKSYSSTIRTREDDKAEDVTRKRQRSEEGVPWYESSGKGKAREVYEEPFDPASSRAFFADTTGDRDALRYSSSSSFRAPRYYRDGQGLVLGYNAGLRVVMTRERTEKGLEVAPRGRPYVPRYSSRMLQGSSRDARRLILRPDTTNGFDSTTSYISFGTKSRNKPRDDLPDYRTITRDDQDEGDEDVEEALDGFDSVEQDVRRRMGEMERHVREHPHDIAAWISYSTLHLNLFSDSANVRTPGTDPASLPQTKASAEVSLSILTKALDHHPNFTSISLHLSFIKAAAAFWPAEKVTARWQNVLRELGMQARADKDLEEGMMGLWLGYIGWREGRGFGKQGEGQKGGGGVDEVIEVYTDCLKILNESTAFGEDDTLKEENQLYLFLRLCLFMKQAGYSERAHASFQALIEITLFKPDYLRPPPNPSPSWFSNLIPNFESFWDSKAPRIGEEGCKGWRHCRANDPQPTPSTRSELEHRSSDPFERWLEAESFAESQNMLSARATDLDAANDDDPFRVVLFSDIQPFLFPIRSPQVRLELVYAFLTFLGLPFKPPDISTSSASSSDPHLNWILLYNDQLRAAMWPPRQGRTNLPWQTVGGEPMEPEVHRALSDPFRCPIKNWASNVDTLFGPPDGWFRDISKADLAHVDIPFARKALNILRPLIPDPSFSAISLAFEAALSPKVASKIAKGALSTDRENYGLWTAYAGLEAQRGHIQAARSVYATVLSSMVAKRVDNATNEELGLWAAWAQLEWDNGQENRCLDIVIAAVLSIQKGDYILALVAPDRIAKPPSAISLLRAKEVYSAPHQPCPFPQLVLASLHATLTSGIDSAQSIITRQIMSVTASSAEKEEAVQLLGRILHVYTSRHASPASLSRDALHLAIATFPNNTQLLSLYLWGELGGRVFGRIQRLVSDMLSADTTGVTGQLWAVWAEAQTSHRTFWDQGGGGAERVRSALDKSINSLNGRHSAPMWRLYIEFETLMGRHAAAKQLCYRAVAAMGGCKPLYLLPFTPSLRPHFTAQELRDWSELMIERGLRIRVAFEEFFDLNETEAAILLPEDDEPEDDELAFLRDREEAKPY